MEDKRRLISKQLAASGTKLVEKAKKKSVHWINEDINQNEKSSSFDSPPKANVLDVSLIKDRVRPRRRHSEVTKFKGNLMLSGPHFTFPSKALSTGRSSSLPCEPDLSVLKETLHECTGMKKEQQESYRQALAAIYNDQEREGQIP